MERTTRSKARAFVVVGFALMAAGSIINAIHLMTTADYFSLASGLDLLELVLAPLVGLVTAWSWWWLSKLRVASKEQVTFVRRAFYGLALQNGLSTVLVLATLFQLPVFDRNSWNVAPLWAQFWGSLAVLVGLILLARDAGVDDEVLTRGHDQENVVTP